MSKVTSVSTKSPEIIQATRTKKERIAAQKLAAKDAKKKAKEESSEDSE